MSTFATDPDNAPKWYTNIKRVAWVTTRPLQIGSQISFVAHFLGRRLAYTYEIIEYVPGVSLSMRTAQRPFPMETRYAWAEPTPGMTRMTLRNRGEPRGFSAFLAPFMGIAMRRANRKDLAFLKWLLDRPD